MTKLEPRTYEHTITTFYGPRIDDIFINVEKDTTYEEDGTPFTAYYIVISPKVAGTATGQIRSAGCAIYSDEDAVKFLERPSGRLF